MQAKQLVVLSSVALLIALVAATPALADREAPPMPYKAVSPHGKVVVEMDVPHGRYPKGTGIARDKASGKILWRVHFHARRILVSDDGVSLVRMGPWARDKKNYTDLAIAFYRSGKLVKQYQVRELLTDTKATRHTVSHYSWQDHSMPHQFSPDQKRFVLFLMDKTPLTFDVATGRIIKVAKEPGLAKQAQQLWQAGVKLQGAGKLDQALAKYQAAYKIWPDPRTKRRINQVRRRIAKGKK